MWPARGFLGASYEHGRRHVGYWVWETDCLPGRYASSAEGLDAIWTPSEYSAESIRRGIGTDIPVEVVPHAVVPRMTHHPVPLPVSLPRDRTLIGFFFDARSVIDRKNPAALLRAFRKAFRADDRVSLVLKVNHGKSARRAMAELEALAEGLPVVWLHDVVLDQLETLELLNKLDIYASLHRAEGFGLVLAEAMSLGKPVVATGYSANTEFMTEDTACLVGHTVIVTEQANGPYPRGTRWADPDVEHAAELLRRLAKDSELCNAIGRKAKRHIEQTLSPRILAELVRRKLGWSDGSPPTSGFDSTESSSVKRSTVSAVDAAS